MKIAFLGGSNAGMVGLLATASRSNVDCVVGYSPEVFDTAQSLRVYTFDSIKYQGFRTKLEKCDMLLCVHGREIVPESILKSIPCINIHPGFDGYKGANPIGRMISEGVTSTDITAHRMTEVLDAGPVIAQRRIKVRDTRVTDMYNSLYKHYASIVLEVIDGYERYF